jgi:RNA polymerase sigma-70 factor (ECF subfamily)
MDATKSVADLLVRVACRCDRAFTLLYERMFDLVLATVRRQLFDEAQSEEVAQEVLLEVWELAARFDARRGNAVSWILTIAQRRAIDRVRASQSSRNRDVLVGLRDQAVPHDNVSELIESRFDSDRLARALERLSPLQREALVATYLEGRTVAAAAVVVGASEAAVKTRVRNGLSRLRDELGVSAA